MSGLRQFLSSILPAEGDFFISVAKGKKLINHKMRSLESLEAGLEAAKEAPVDLYFGTAAFDGHRRIVNCLGKRAFYIDIDTDPERVKSPYADQREILTDIVRATQDGLPPPTHLVSSGGGIHVYWALKDTVSPDDWLPTARVLVKACKALKLGIDPGITVDIARIMRAPGSNNHKTDTPRRCALLKSYDISYSLEEFHQAVTQLAPEEVIASDKVEALPDPDASHLRLLPGGLGAETQPDDLSSGLQAPTYKPLPAGGMMKLCRVMAKNLALGGAGEKEPVWKQVVHTLTFSSDGKDYLHPVSKGHAGYDPVDTEAKWQASLTARQNAPNLGPTKCSTFETLGCKECAKCPFRRNSSTKTQSPLHLSSRLPDGVLPPGFRQGAIGVERQAVDPKDGSETWIPVSSVHITNMDLYRSDLNENHFMVADIDDGDRQTRVVIDAGEAADARKLSVAWASQTGRILSAGSGVKSVHQLFSSFSEIVASTRGAAASTDQFGWQPTGAFCSGALVHKGGETTPSRIRDSRLVKTYSPGSGATLHDWKAGAEVVLGQNRPAAWAVLASAFAAPLMRFTGVPGGILSVISKDSGTGKTTLMRLAQSVWGDPRTGLNSLNDTNNSLMKKLGVLQNLPMYWDEVRGNDAALAEFAKTVFQITQGAEKTRLNSDSSMKSSGNWNTMVCTASNFTLSDRVLEASQGSDAGGMRVFELTMPEIKANESIVGSTGASDLRDATENHYGVAGALYAKALGKLGPQTVKEVMRRCEADLYKRIEDRGYVTVLPVHRFWIATILSLTVGARIANQIKVCSFDVEALTDYLLEEFEKHVGRSEGWKDNGVELDLLAEFLRTNEAHTLVTTTLPSRGRVELTTKDIVRFPTVNREDPVPVRVRMSLGAEGDEPEPPMLRVSLKDFKVWLSHALKSYAYDYSPATVVNRLLEKKGCHKGRSRLTAGCTNALTEYGLECLGQSAKDQRAVTAVATQPQIQCIDINLRAEPFKELGVIEEYKKPNVAP